MKATSIVLTLLLVLVGVGFATAQAVTEEPAGSSDRVLVQGDRESIRAEVREAVREALQDAALEERAPISDERREALVELFAESRDLSIVYRQCFMSPRMSDRGQESDERNRTRQQDLLCQSVFNQREVLLQCRTEQRFARQKHHHHLWRVRQLLPVGLVAEAVHVVAHLSRMRLQAKDATFVIGAFLRIEKRLERRFGIHDDLLTAREMDDQVWAKPAVLRRDARLFVEIAALEHSSEFDDTSELHFTPAASNSGCAQRARQHVCR